MIKRHNLRCVSCKSCALACPFGTIYMELLPFYAMDYHAAVAAVMNMGSASIASSGGEPDTMGLTPLEQCIHGAVSIGDIDADADAHIVDKHLAVRTRPWRRVERGEAET